MPDRATIHRTLGWAIRLALRIVLGGYFVLASLDKIWDPRMFALRIMEYKLLPDPWPSLMAISLPWFELLAGLGVVTRLLYRGSLAAITGMLLIFMAALGSLIARNLDADCGCFGNGESPEQALVRDVVLLAIAGFLIVDEMRKTKRSSAAQPLDDGPGHG